MVSSAIPTSPSSSGPMSLARMTSMESVTTRPTTFWLKTQIRLLTICDPALPVGVKFLISSMSFFMFRILLTSPDLPQHVPYGGTTRRIRIILPAVR